MGDREPDGGALLAPHRRFGERDREAAAGDVLGRRDQPSPDRLADEDLEGGFASEVDGRRVVLRRRTRERRVGGSGQARPGLAGDQDRVVGQHERRTDQGGDVIEQTDHPDLGRRRDGARGRLVVERDIAAGDREPEGPTRVGETADALAKLPERLGPRRVAVVEAVRHAQRPGARDGHVPGGLRDRQRRAEPWVEDADRLVAVGRGDERLRRALDPQDRRAVPRARDGVGTDRGVVLPEDVVARREVRRTEQRQQDRARIRAPFGEAIADEGRGTRGRGAALVGRGRGGTVVDDGVAGQGAGRDARQFPGARRGPAIGVQPAFDDRDVAVGRDATDDRHRQAPPFADLADRLPALGQDRGAHPFLRLGDQHLERFEARLPPRDGVQVHDDPGPGPVGRLRGRAGDPAGAQVLEALDESALDQFQAGLDEQLLGERVADLDRRPLRGIVVGEGRARQDGRPADPVATGRRAVQHDEVAWPRRRGQGQEALLHQPDGHHVDQRVPGIRRIEHQLAADRRDADAVAVAADPADDPIDQVARPGVGRIAEAERIEHGDRPGAHREDVAQDPADAGRGTLVRLHRRRVVVRLDLERDREAVPDRDDTGILAGPRDDPFARGRQRPQERLRALVRAVLAPHHAEHGEFEVIRFAVAQPFADRLELVVGHAETTMERLDQALRHGHRVPAPTTTGAPATARSALSTSDRTIPNPSSEPRTASDARSGCGISPATLPALFMTPAIARSAPFGLAAVLRPGRRARRIDVPEEDLPVALERVERRLVGVVAPLAVGHRHPQRTPGVDRMREGRVEPFGRDPDLLPDEPQRGIPQQRPGDEARLGQHLEAVADPEHEPAVRGEPGHRPHDRAEPGDDPGPHVVAVGEAAGQDDRGGAVEGRLFVPQGDRVGPRQRQGVERIAIAVAAREDDDPDPHCHRHAPRRPC